MKTFYARGKDGKFKKAPLITLWNQRYRFVHFVVVVLLYCVLVLVLCLGIGSTLGYLCTVANICEADNSTMVAERPLPTKITEKGREATIPTDVQSNREDPSAPWLTRVLKDANLIQWNHRNPKSTTSWYSSLGQFRSSSPFLHDNKPTTLNTMVAKRPTEGQTSSIAGHTTETHTSESLVSPENIYTVVASRPYGDNSFSSDISSEDHAFLNSHEFLAGSLDDIVSLPPSVGPSRNVSSAILNEMTPHVLLEEQHVNGRSATSFNDMSPGTAFQIALGINIGRSATLSQADYYNEIFDIIVSHNSADCVPYGDTASMTPSPDQSPHISPSWSAPSPDQSPHISTTWNHSIMSRPQGSDFGGSSTERSELSSTRSSTDISELSRKPLVKSKREQIGRGATFIARFEKPK